MPIDKLNSTASIIAALRGDPSDRGEHVRREKTPPSAGAKAVLGGRGDIKVLRQQLADLVKSVPIDDEEALKRLRPQMVRSILLWEFGASLRDHPDWQPMLDNITQSLAKHPSHEANFLKLLTDLKR
jgi:hypothetical protein